MRKQCASILVGYNLPWLLWTAYAITLPWLADGIGWRCPVGTAAGWCPGCGLTTAYSQMLYGRAWPSVWLTVVLMLFLINGYVSLVKIYRLAYVKGLSQAG